MNKFTLDDRTLLLLKAQANLSQTFSHTLRSPLREALSFTLKVERSKADTLFTIELQNQKHTLTLRNGPKAHLKLAEFIEEIINDPHHTGTLSPAPHACCQSAGLDAEQVQQVFNLVRTGGAMSLHMGFELPIQLAVHRSRTRQAITTIMSIGVKRPRTKCFTVCGSDAHMYEAVIECINHLAAAATPAAHAA